MKDGWYKTKSRYETEATFGYKNDESNRKKNREELVGSGKEVVEDLIMVRNGKK